MPGKHRDQSLLKSHCCLLIEFYTVDVFIIRFIYTESVLDLKIPPRNNNNYYCMIDFKGNCDLASGKLCVFKVAFLCSDV